jgi:hypothetical protein
MKKFLIFAGVALILSITAVLIGSTNNAEPSNKEVCAMSKAQATCPMVAKTSEVKTCPGEASATCNTSAACSDCDKACPKGEDCPDKATCEKRAACPNKDTCTKKTE